MKKSLFMLTKRAWLSHLVHFVMMTCYGVDMYE